MKPELAVAKPTTISAASAVIDEPRKALAIESNFNPVPIRTVPSNV
jgi:hypothetical protein